MAFFNLRQKVYICIYAHIDINKIYKSKKAGQLLLWIWINKTKWLNESMTDVTKSPTSTEFSVLVLDYFFTKIRYSWISHANLAMWWWRSSKIFSSTVVDLCLFLHVMSWLEQLLLKKKERLTDDLLTLSVTFTWFYKTENIVM